MKNLVIIGNCQSQALRKTILEVVDDWAIYAHEVHEVHSSEQLKFAGDCLAKADLVFTQPVKNGRFNSSELALNLRNSTPVYTFPSMYFKGQLPTLTQFRKENNIPINTPGFSYHEGIIAELVQRNYKSDKIFDMLSNPELLSAEFILKHSQNSLLQLVNREIENRIDIKISGVISDYIGEEKLFHVFNHPSRRLIAHTANVMLRYMGSCKKVKDSGEDYLSFPGHPILPTVARTLGLDAQVTSKYFYWATKKISFEEFVYKQIDCFRNLKSEDLAESFRETVGWGAISSDLSTELNL